jgi:hypothetical protein
MIGSLKIYDTSFVVSTGFFIQFQYSKNISVAPYPNAGWY